VFNCKNNKNPQFAALRLTLLPDKSVAIGLLFTIFFGPLGLLYATFWGGASMLLLAIVVFGSHLQGVIILFWLLCNLWGVAAVTCYNNKIIAARLKIANEQDNSAASITS
jgi:hypothetical protein